MKRIVITGSAGYLGSKLVDLLAQRGGWEIHGIDIKEPPDRKPYRRFITGSVTNMLQMQLVFDRARPDVAVHLAFIVETTHNRRLEESVAIEGTRNFLDCCERTMCQEVIFLSSAAAYGAHDDNDLPLTEKSPIRGVQGYGYSRLKAKADIMAQEFATRHPSCRFVILRPCLFLGPNTKNNFFDVLRYPIVPRIRDKRGLRDPEFQFIHEDDMAACIVCAIEKCAHGTYNVASEGTARFSELVQRFGKKMIAIPSWIIYPATAILWKLRLITTPPAMLNFIRYPWIMDASRMQKELYRPTKSSIEAFETFALTHQQ